MVCAPVELERLKRSKGVKIERGKNCEVLWVVNHKGIATNPDFFDFQRSRSLNQGILSGYDFVSNRWSGCS